VALRPALMAMARAMATAMRQATMTATPPVTTADTHLPTTVDMPRHITVTGIEEYTVRPMPTTAAPDIMAAGITGGIVIGNSESQPRYGSRHGGFS